MSKRCAIRVSEFEALESATNSLHVASWVWLDCPFKFPLESEEVRMLEELRFKLCIVSPELHGHRNDEETFAMKRDLGACVNLVDTVCTKKTKTMELAIRIS